MSNAGWIVGPSRLWVAAWILLTGSAIAESEPDPASFVGQQACVACHQLANEHWSHTIHALAFQDNPRSDLERRGCEACHGPGSEHVGDPKRADGIVRFTRNSEQSIGQQNGMCMACHDGGQRIHWDASVHQINELACSDCHNPMARFSTGGLLAQESVSETCYTCHREQRVEFEKRSHMPLPEGKLSCADCHNPHGSRTDPLLKTDTVNETCYGCHAEKRGPFLWEHAPVTEDCLNCHRPHGSNHEKLLVTARPVLCQQCHTMIGHINDLITQGHLASGSAPDTRAIARSCSTCHSQIHGSNHPAGVKFQR